MKVHVGPIGNSEDSRALYILAETWRASKVVAIYYPSRSTLDVMEGCTRFIGQAIEALRVFEAADSDRRSWVAFPIRVEYW